MAVNRPAADAPTFETRAAMYLSAATAVIAVATLVAALLAVPISGANCPSGCIDYPYLDTADRYPRDYVWMYLAIGMVVVYLLFVTSLRAVAPPERQLFGQMAVAVAVVATTVLSANYFVQASVVPSSVAAGETAGITLLTQYNPHGVFIALEEIGHLLMITSFILLAPLIGGAGKRTAAVRLLFVAPLPVSVLALAAYSIAYGLDRQDRFEVAIITVAWLVLITNGTLLTLIFRERLARSEASE